MWKKVSRDVCEGKIKKICPTKFMSIFIDAKKLGVYKM